MEKAPRTAFVSYTRRSGAACADRLQTLLHYHDIGVWRDATHMIAGVDFWRQIEDAIERCSHLVMVLTPDALDETRQILRREWYTARKFGTCVVPVMSGSDMRPEERLPRWLPSRHIYSLDTESERLVEQLTSPCTIERVPFMADDLPPDYVARGRTLAVTDYRGRTHLLRLEGVECATP